MSDAIAAIKQQVGRQLAARVKPLYLATDDRLHLLDAKGNGAVFGLHDLRTGIALDDSLPFLLTAEHRPGNVLEWSFVELPNAAICHVHALALDAGWAVALLMPAKNTMPGNSDSRRRMSYCCCATNGSDSSPSSKPPIV